jgi:hypothetical protein
VIETRGPTAFVRHFRSFVRLSTYDAREKRIMYILSGYLHSLFVHVFCIRAMIWILGVILSIVYSPVSISHLRVSLLILWNKKKCKGGKRRTTDTPFEYWWPFLIASRGFYEQKKEKKSHRVAGDFRYLFFFFFSWNFLFCFNILKA